jgi:hypothetical protein
MSPIVIIDVDLTIYVNAKLHTQTATKRETDKVEFEQTKNDQNHGGQSLEEESN